MKTCRKGLHQFTGVQCRECWAIGQRARRKAERMAHPERRHITEEHRKKISATRLKRVRFPATYVKSKREYIPRNTFANNLWKYKLTVQAFAELWRRADGKCENPGCRRVLDLNQKSWAIDHDHSCCPGAKTCGRCIRGLMCSQCNVALGYLGDSESKALGLVEYLHRCSTLTQSSQ